MILDSLKAQDFCYQHPLLLCFSLYPFETSAVPLHTIDLFGGVYSGHLVADELITHYVGDRRRRCHFSCPNSLFFSIDLNASIDISIDHTRRRSSLAESSIITRELDWNFRWTIVCFIPSSPLCFFPTAATTLWTSKFLWKITQKLGIPF